MIIRAIHDRENPYFQMRRATAQNRRLTWEARGVLAYLFSKPDDWQLSVEDLIAQTKGSRKPLGRDGVQAVLKELEDCRHLHRHQERNPDGTLGQWVSDIYENPLLKLPRPEPAQPVPAEPAPVEPEPAEPLLHNIDRTTKNRRKQNTEAAAADPASIAAADQPLQSSNSPSNAFAGWTEAHLSEHEPATIVDYVEQTKEGKSNPRGLARQLWRSGEEDAMIWEWLEQFAQKQQQKQRQRLAVTHVVCPACGEAEAFTLNPDNKAEGYCNVEDAFFDLRKTGWQKRKELHTWTSSQAA